MQRRPSIALRALLAFLQAAAAVALTAGSVSAAAGDDDAAARLLERARARYAELRSYQDTGTVVTEHQLPNGPLVVERHSFRTRYRAPRSFLLDFREDEAAGGDRFVLWGGGGDLNTWWLTTRVHDVYPQGRGIIAFAMAALPTHRVANLIPPLLFAAGGLGGPLHNLIVPRLGRVETIGGRSCQEVLALDASSYATGGDKDDRPIRVFIDPETLLVCRVIDETPEDALPGSIDRATTTFDALAGPALADSEFDFAPPR
jgi:hypothetical protein